MDSLTPQRADQPADLILVGGRVVTPTEVLNASVVIRKGRIDAVVPGDSGLPLPQGKRLDVTGKYVLPGLIDSHVHFRTPGLEYKEDWEHGSRAALAGGVTTVMDMPNTIPPALDPATIEAKAAVIEGTSWVDYRFHIGADPSRPEILADLDPNVATSSKVFMAGHHTAPTVVRDPRQLEAIFEQAAAGRVRLVLHAEDQGLFDLLDSWQGTPQSYGQYEPNRPRSGAIIAVSHVLELVRRHGTAAHILHTSTAEEADMITAARAAGLPVTFEVTGHHLSFVDEDIHRLGARTRLSPAIRGRDDQDRLWQAVINGQAATLGSDHAPHPIVEKMRPAPDAPPGLPGVQELATAVWSGWRMRHPDESADTIALRLAQMMGAHPAEMFHLPGKGRIEAGADADLVVFDPDRRWALSSDDVQAKCGWSAYEGWTFRGRVDMTLKSGCLVWEAEQGFHEGPRGRWLPSGLTSPASSPLAGAPA